MARQSVRATHPEPRGQKCSPYLLFVILGVVVLAFVAFLVMRPGMSLQNRKVPTASTTVPATSNQ